MGILSVMNVQLKALLRVAVLGGLMSGLLVGCASLDVETGGAGQTMTPAQAPENSAKPAVDASAPLSSSATELATSSDSTSRAEPIIYRGNDRQVRVPAAREPVQFVGDDVSLNFEKAPLSEVVHAIVGDILGLDYMVDGAIQGEVTLRTRTPIPRNEVLGVLESLLKANNALLIRGNDNRYLVTASPEAVGLSPQVTNPRSLAPGYTTIVIPLQYISAGAMAEILTPVASEKALVRVDNTRNLIMLAGTQEQLAGWLEIISTFDVDMLKGMSVGLFPLENAQVDEVAEGLASLIEVGGGAGEQGGSLSQLIRIIPFERLNSILVVTPRSHYLDTAKTWIERLDVAPNSLFEKRLFVYPVQNTTASRLAELMNSIYTGQGGGQQNRGAGTSGFGSNRGTGVSDSGSVAPGLSRESIGDSSGGVSNNRNQQNSSITAVNMGAAGTSQVSDVRVVADDENNALMVYATGKQYEIIRDALDRLDVVATQVIIEASILEVTLTDELKYGLEWTFKGGLGSDYDGVGVLADAAAGPASDFPGFSYTITNSIGDISAVLNALSQESLVNIISTPSVMVLDNHVAAIQVGEQVPVRRGTTVTDGGTTTENIEYRDTGVQLTVRPSVNAGGLVTMDVEQSVTDVGQIDVGGNRRFLERKITSRVAVRSSESVVLGGLIRENASNTDDGVPFLHTVPLIGPLFGTTEKSTNRTELLVIITPRALYNETELRQVSDEMRSQVRNLELLSVPE